MNPTIEPLTLTETLAVGIPALALWAWWIVDVLRDRKRRRNLR